MAGEGEQSTSAISPSSVETAASSTGLGPVTGSTHECSIPLLTGWYKVSFIILTPCQIVPGGEQTGPLLRMPAIVIDLEFARRANTTPSTQCPDTVFSDPNFCHSRIANIITGTTIVKLP
ncbi:hypothetical protein PI124_g8500 [Phytophthora idaei]|nr:hypothetical protein PI125_g10600 [Phytophthora idaei]KAG3153678.1 hypothetical protein PI126_g9970 [Phytophthora idaei]KAG3246797.1 hypothetical protein PI124_g8500 [Phytophthora idaei]